MKLGPEDIECRALVEYLDTLVNQGKVVVYSHTAQETYTRSWNQKRKNKILGVRSGVPDYLVVTPNNILFIEMKRKKGGTTSKAQKEWIKAINEAGGNAVVCKGFEAAKEYLDERTTS